MQSPVSTPPPPPPPPRRPPPPPPRQQQCFGSLFSLFRVVLCPYFSLSSTTALIASLVISLIIFVVYVAQHVIREHLANTRSQRERDTESGRLALDRQAVITVLEREGPRPLDLRHALVEFVLFDSLQREGEEGEGASECAICLRGFKRGEVCGILQRCNHVFHESCIMPWLRLSSTCPLCRTDAFSD